MVKSRVLLQALERAYSPLLAVMLLTMVSHATAQWTRHELPQLGRAQFTCMVYHEGFVYGGTDEGRVFRSPANTVDFVDWGQGLNTSSVDVVQFAGTIAYAETDDGIFYRDVDAASWQWLDRSDTLQGIRALTSVGDTLIVASLRNYVYVLPSPTSAWTTVPIPDSLRPLKDLDVHGGYVYAAAERGLWKTPDLFRTLEEIVVDTGIGEVSLAYVADDGVIITRVYAKDGGGAVNGISRDGGRTFEELPILGGRNLQRIGMDDRFGTIVIVSYDEDAYRSVARSQYWEPLDAGFLPADVDLEVVCIGDGLVFAAAGNDEVWTRPESHVVLDVPMTAPPKAPYRIRYTDHGLVIDVEGASHSSTMRARIVDVLGREWGTVILDHGENVVSDVPFPCFVQVIP